MWKCLVCGEVQRDLTKLKPHLLDDYTIPMIRCRPMSMAEIIEYQNERGDHAILRSGKNQRKDQSVVGYKKSGRKTY